MTESTALCITWFAGLFQGLALGIVFFPGLRRRGKVFAVGLQIVALGFIIWSVLATQ